MSNVIEIKAMSQEAAITRALKIMEATPDQVVKVTVKQKSRSFLGLFNKEGIYEIEINKNLGVKSKAENNNKQNIDDKKEEKVEVIKEKKVEIKDETVEVLEEKIEIKEKVKTSDVC